MDWTLEELTEIITELEGMQRTLERKLPVGERRRRVLHFITAAQADLRQAKEVYENVR